MRLLSELFGFLLTVTGFGVPHFCAFGRSGKPRYFSSVAFIVILALRTFDTGHPALAFSAAF